MNSHLHESLVKREELLQGQFLKVLRDTVRLPNGRDGTREYIVHPGAAMVIPMLDDGRLVMERQYRYPVQQVILEFPAGKRDPNEDMLVCAQRELREETGYIAKEWARAGQVHPVISYSTEVIDIWFARGLSQGERRLDDEEFLDIVAVSADDVMQSCFNGGITDSKTLAGALWLQNFLSGKVVLQWQTV